MMLLYFHNKQKSPPSYGGGDRNNGLITLLQHFAVLFNILISTFIAFIALGTPQKVTQMSVSTFLATQIFFHLPLILSGQC